jgi:hypothetical protein
VRPVTPRRKQTSKPRSSESTYSAAQQICVPLTVLHEHAEVLCRLLAQREVRDGVTVDEHQSAAAGAAQQVLYTSYPLERLGCFMVVVRCLKTLPGVA